MTGLFADFSAPLDPKVWGSHFHCCPKDTAGGPVLDTARTNVVNGRLEISALQVAGRWHSGLIDTKVTGPGRGFEQLYGSVEARIRIPKGFGLWPAFWQYAEGTNPDGTRWYNEIDTLEAYCAPKGRQPGYDVATLHTTLHGPNGSQEGHATATVDLSRGFHIFGHETTPKDVVFRLDGREVWRYSGPLQPKHPMPLILNLGVGGSHGKPDASTPPNPKMLVDWVRAAP